MGHLLLGCSKTRVLWDLLFSLFRVSWILSTTVKDSLLGWMCSFLVKEKRRVWNAGPLCIFEQIGRPEMTLFLEMRFCLYKG